MTAHGEERFELNTGIRALGRPSAQHGDQIDHADYNKTFFIVNWVMIVAENSPRRYHIQRWGSILQVGGSVRLRF